MLIDRFKRQATDLRISVTDRCNYRCLYCMPEHVEWIPKPEVLSFEEITHLAKIFASEGVNEIRLTGGEPLARKQLPRLISMLKSISGISSVSLTTNGFYLKDQAQPLRDAGIDRINISLDSLRPDRFAEITRNNSLDRVLEGIGAAQRAGFSPIKINCVAIRGFNDDEIIDFLEWGTTLDLQIRFIEFMPLDGDHRWTRLNVLTEKEILDKVREFYAVREIPSKDMAPATRFSFANNKAEFGIIASVSEPFCGDCSRIRLTADGKLRTCLFSLQETDLRAPLRQGLGDGEIVKLIQAAVLEKWAGHRINESDFVQPPRAMYAIGG
jgi:GTP 3',8-cyclase